MKDEPIIAAARAVELLEQAAELLRDNLPELEKRVAQAKKLAQDFDAAKIALEKAEERANSATIALRTMESAVEAALDAARESVYAGNATVEQKLKLLELFKSAFSHLSKAGFEIWIPQIGEPIDPERFLIRGRAKSQLGADAVADVVSWGFKFPSGAMRQAEVLAGDGSVKPAEETPSAKHRPTPKAGISMLMPEKDESPKPKRKQPTTTADSIFDQLTQAAQKNRPKQ